MNKNGIKNAIYGLVLLITMYGVYRYREAKKEPATGNDTGIVQTSFSGLTMGSTYAIKYTSLPQKAINYQAEIDSILEKFNESLSTYRPDSEISRFNNGHAVAFRLPFFYPVLKKSQEVYQASGGAFDPTVGPLVNAWGFGTGKERKAPSQARIDSLKEVIGFDKITFDEQSVQKAKEGVYIDFNAIAPGYAADVIGQFLESKGIQDYMIEVGGEVLCKGKNKEGKYWTIGINNPEYEQKGGDVLQAIVQLDNKALATSGNYRNYYEQDGKKYAHTIDPKTGYPVQHSLLSVTVFAKDCITADAYATVFMVLGREKAMEFLDKDDELDAFFVYADPQGNLQTFTTEGIKPYIEPIQ
ncbi:FAD:protein FMN transferase [Rhodocytophaga aerolata]|uniref:FAD:protein FMN transferase n=1 Tax=Rhodocytophaga aerolata TaxID=455078 RepID=A0ABT8R5U2_9BACT|nr:FAD:protein FMN transferase [Rhodocytophaga aerolata]MDO1447304.1 FAD:protein FMN transferase [Rhodocytophaga aerolata]